MMWKRNPGMEPDNGRNHKQEASFEVQCSRYEAELENYQNNIWEEYGITWNTAVHTV